MSDSQSNIQKAFDTQSEVVKSEWLKKCPNSPTAYLL